MVRHRWSCLLMWGVWPFRYTGFTYTMTKKRFELRMKSMVPIQSSQLCPTTSQSDEKSDAMTAPPEDCCVPYWRFLIPNNCPTPTPGTSAHCAVRSGFFSGVVHTGRWKRSASSMFPFPVVQASLPVNRTSVEGIVRTVAGSSCTSPRN